MNGEAFFGAFLSVWSQCALAPNSVEPEQHEKFMGYWWDEVISPLLPLLAKTF